VIAICSDKFMPVSTCTYLREFSIEVNAQPNLLIVHSCSSCTFIPEKLLWFKWVLWRRIEMKTVMMKSVWWVVHSHTFLSLHVMMAKPLSTVVVHREWENPFACISMLYFWVLKWKFGLRYNLKCGNQKNKSNKEWKGGDSGSSKNKS
jgi:hypothetical protein